MTGTYRRLVLEQQENLLHGFSFSMAPAMSMDEIGAAIYTHFPSMGIERWYVMFYSDVTAPQSISAPPPESYSERSLWTISWRRGAGKYATSGKP